MSTLIRQYPTDYLTLLQTQESSQYSAIVTELSDQDCVGTALTLQIALGFSVTVLAIFAVPAVEVRIVTPLFLL